VCLETIDVNENDFSQPHRRPRPPKAVLRNRKQGKAQLSRAKFRRAVPSLALPSGDLVEPGPYIPCWPPALGRATDPRGVRVWVRSIVACAYVVKRISQSHHKILGVPCRNRLPLVVRRRSRPSGAAPPCPECAVQDNTQELTWTAVSKKNDTDYTP
jgi:hypothetical protein